MNRRLLPILLILTAAFCLFTSGCIPEGYTKDEKEAYRTRAKAKMQEYLDTNLPGALVTATELIDTLSDSVYERVLTDYAEGTFSYDDGEYRFVIDTAGGDIYTSLYLEAVKNELLSGIINTLGVSFTEAYMPDCTIRPEKLGDRASDLGFCFENVFLSEDTAEDIVRDIIGSKEVYSFYGEIQYKGAGDLESIKYKAAPFPSVSQLRFYHVFDDEQLIKDDEYFYTVLPCISKETLSVYYADGNMVYVKNAIAKRDGFRIIYNAYSEVNAKDQFSSNVIDDGDISLTVMKNYIELTCDKEGCELYLFTDDPKITEKYLYIRRDRYSVSDRAKYGKGTWRPLGTGSVYSDYESLGFPYAFDGKSGADMGSGGRIYTKSGMKRQKRRDR